LSAFESEQRGTAPLRSLKIPHKIPKIKFNIFPVINNNMNKYLISYFGPFKK
jgi:hypothetical protein